MPLTDALVRSLTAENHSYRRSDDRGLYIEVFPTGSRLWRYKYRYNGKEKRLALGSYPQVKLGEARRKRDAARLQLNEGVDPLLERKLAKASPRNGAVNTFSSIAEEFVRKRGGRASRTLQRARPVGLSLCSTRPLAN